MMRLNDYRNGHSAEVQMRLILNGSSFGIAQLGPEFLILHEPREYPPTEAEISLVVDGKEEKWRVKLPEGMHAAKQIVPISSNP